MFFSVAGDEHIAITSGPALYLAIIRRWPELLGRIAMTTDDEHAEHVRAWLEINPCHLLRKPLELHLVTRWLETALHPKDESAAG